jgi:hypothetical protein
MARCVLIGGGSHEEVVEVSDECDEIEIKPPESCGFCEAFSWLDTPENYTRRAPRIFALKSMRDEDVQIEIERLPSSFLNHVEK